MSHDKIRAAARKRMAETGEPYATARREVIKDHQEAGAPSSGANWFAISYSDMDRFSLWMDTLMGGGPGRGAWRSTRPCCGYGWPISTWTSLAARCDRPPA